MYAFGRQRPDGVAMATTPPTTYIDVSRPGQARMSFAVTRRTLIDTVARACVAVSLGLVTGGLSPRSARAARHPHACRRVGSAGPHPDPRPGIDASRMPPPEAVRGHPHAVSAFDEARTIPQILDGIRCQCGCATEPGMRSLLSCYEGTDAMALDCDICQGQVRLAYRLHGQGRTLDQIRAAIDARYGG
jgi:hypothetical protein